MSFFEHYAKFGLQFQEDLKEVLLGDAAEAVKDIMVQKLDDVVYSYPASDLAMASRRYDYGGLKDRENMTAHVEPGLTLVVENVAPFQDASAFQGEALSDVVERALPGYRQPGPRPFIADTEAECVSSGSVLNAINDGLQKKGYQIEHAKGGI